MNSHVVIQLQYTRGRAVIGNYFNTRASGTRVVITDTTLPLVV